LTDLRTRKRETEALIRGSDKLSCDNLSIITEDFEGEEEINGKRIVYKPLWKWLLGF